MPTRFLTRQQIFSRTVKHLRAQGAKAKNKNSKCVYKTKDSRTCAIGHFISPKNYQKTIEGIGLSHIAGLLKNPGDSYCGVSMKRGNIFKNILLKSRLNVNNEDTNQFLWDLQNIHDCNDVENWEGLSRGFILGNRELQIVFPRNLF